MQSKFKSEMGLWFGVSFLFLLLYKTDMAPILELTPVMSSLFQESNTSKREGKVHLKNVSQVLKKFQSLKGEIIHLRLSFFKEFC